MHLRADVHCYLCGDVSGTWEWPAGYSPDRGVFQDAEGRRAVSLLRHVRCRRCGGGVYLDEVDAVRPRPPVAFEPVRRGRPPSAAQRLVS
jgi:hypothetical protein